jgi:hypothetical protein
LLCQCDALLARKAKLFKNNLLAVIRTMALGTDGQDVFAQIEQGGKRLLGWL